MFEGNLSGPEILELETEYSVRQSNVSKATGPDNISYEVLKTLGQDGVGVPCKLFNQICNQGYCQERCASRSLYQYPRSPEHYYVKNTEPLGYISQRFKAKIETELNANQFGFRSDIGTRNAVFVLNNIGQRSIEMQKEIYMSFVDYTKAFDRIEHNNLMHFLNDLSLDDKDLRVIQALYYQQYAAIPVNSKRSEIVAIKCSVRQGYILSPDLFSLFSEIIIRSLDNLQGVSIGGHNINNLRYADDTVLLAHTEEDLQALLNELDIRSRSFGMEINSKKTEVMIFTKKGDSDAPSM